MEIVRFKNGSVNIVSNDAQTVHVIQIQAGPLVYDAFRVEGELDLPVLMKAAEDRIKRRVREYPILENLPAQAWLRYDACGGSFEWRLIIYCECPDFEAQWKAFGQLQKEISKYRKKIIC